MTATKDGKFAHLHISKPTILRIKNWLKFVNLYTGIHSSSWQLFWHARPLA